MKIKQYPQTRKALISWHRLYLDLSKESLGDGRKEEAAYFWNYAVSTRRSIKWMCPKKAA